MKMNTNSLSLLDSFWCFKLMNLSLASTDMVPWHLSQGGGMDLVGFAMVYPGPSKSPSRNWEPSKIMDYHRIFLK